MVTELEELEHIGAGLAKLDLTLGFEDGDTGKSKSEEWFELWGLVAPSKQSVELSSHVALLQTQHNKGALGRLLLYEMTTMKMTVRPFKSITDTDSLFLASFVLYVVWTNLLKS